MDARPVSGTRSRWTIKTAAMLAALLAPLVPQALLASSACDGDPTGANLEFAIPDGVPLPPPESGFLAVSRAQPVAGGVITRVDVYLRIEHPRMSDLRITLKPATSDLSQQITLYAGGCTGANMNVILDDTAQGNVSGACDAFDPQVEGRIQPAAPGATTGLSAYIAGHASGTWTLTVTDSNPLPLEDGVTPSAGRIVEWCVNINDPEGDVAPRGPFVGASSGNNLLSVSDFVDEAYLLAGIENLGGEASSLPLSRVEFGRFDTSPRSSAGDGVIGVEDLGQTARYAIAPVGFESAGLTNGPIDPDDRIIRLGQLDDPDGTHGDPLGVGSDHAPVIIQGTSTGVDIFMASRGNEHEVSFSLQFDPNRVDYVSAERGRTVPEEANFVLINPTVAGSGKVGIEIGLPPAGFGCGTPPAECSTFAPGKVHLAHINFQAASGTVTSTELIQFNSTVLPQTVRTLTGKAMASQFADGVVTFKPTATVDRTIRVDNTALQRGNVGGVRVDLQAQGGSNQGENTMGFGLAFDSSLLTLLDIEAGDDLPADATLVANTADSFSGEATVLIALQPGTFLPAGRRNILRLVFDAAGGTEELDTDITFTDLAGTYADLRGNLFNVPRGVGNPNGQRLFPVDFVPGSIHLCTEDLDCTYSLTTVAPNPNPPQFGTAGGTGNFTVTANECCSWQATLGASSNWITITAGGSGSGDGVVSYKVAPNTGAPRTGSISVADQLFIVTQDGCSFAIDPIDRTFSPGAGTGTIDVAATSDCSWVATTQVSWITILSGASGRGDGTVTYALEQNNGAPRSGVITVAGQAHTVTQSTCSFALNNPALAFGAAGGTAEFIVDTLPGCAWTAVETSPFVTILSGFNGTGPGRVKYQVAAFTGSGSRTATITVGGATHNVSQTNCAYSLSANARTFGATGSGDTFDVVAAGACSWTATTIESWITITSAPAGSGNGSVSYTVSDNTSGSQRRGVILVGGAAYSITQNPCIYLLSPVQAEFTADGGGITSTGSPAEVSVAADTVCPWVAAADAEWIVLNGDTEGSGNGTVSYFIQPNGDPDTRIGHITIGGQRHTITQKSCEFALTPETASFTPDGGVGSFDIAAASSCTWTAVTTDEWITITGGVSGQGAGSVTYIVATNETAQRTGHIVVNGSEFTVSQDCRVTISENFGLFAAKCDTRAVGVNGAPPETCDIDGADGQRVSVDAGSVRVIDHAGLTVTYDAVQDGETVLVLGVMDESTGVLVADTIVLIPTSVIVDPDGLTARSGEVSQRTSTSFLISIEGACRNLAGQFLVSAPAGCAWQATSGEPWIQIGNDEVNTGSQTVQFRLDQNKQETRIGTITVAGQEYVVVQLGGGNSGELEGDLFPTIASPVFAGEQLIATDGSVRILDWINAGKLTAGNGIGDLALGARDGREFQSLDTAPKTSSGDAVLSVADWVQAGRYASSINATNDDDPQVIDGPYSKSNVIVSFDTAGNIENAENARVLSALRGTEFTVANKINIPEGSDISRFQYVFSYDKGAMVYDHSERGSYLQTRGDASLQVFDLTNGGTLGRLGVQVTLPPGAAPFDAGKLDVAHFVFNANAGSGAVTTDLAFTNSADNNTLVKKVFHSDGSEVCPAYFANASITLFGANTPDRILRFGRVGIDRDTSNTVPVVLDAVGDENAAGFTVVFDPKVLQFEGAAVGRSVPTDGALFVNTGQAATGRVGILVGLQPGRGFVAGPREIALLTFTALGDPASPSATTALAFEDTVDNDGTSSHPREICDALARPLPTVFSTGEIIIIGGQTGCSFSLSPPTASVGVDGTEASGTALEFGITTGGDCAWSARTDAPWIFIDEPNAAFGSGLVRYRVEANCGESRTAVITAAGQTHTVTQDAQAFTINPAAIAHFPVVGGEQTVQVRSNRSVTPGCPWTVQTDATWIHLDCARCGPPGGEGIGNAQVVYSVEPNFTGSARTAEIVIANVVHRITQDPCTYSTAPIDNSTVPAGGGRFDFEVNTASFCPYTLSPTVDWILIPDQPVDLDPNHWFYDVLPNDTGAERDGDILVGPAVFHVHQFACSFAIAPATANYPGGGTVGISGQVTITTENSCRWRATSDVSWINFGIDDATGEPKQTVVGDDTTIVRYKVDANDTGINRSGTLTFTDFGGRIVGTHTVTQGRCVYELRPLARIVGFEGGALKVTVATSGTCPWTAEVTSGADFVHITSGASGQGQLDIRYTVDENPSPELRTAEITVTTLDSTIIHRIDQYGEGTEFFSFDDTAEGWLFRTVPDFSKPEGEFVTGALHTTTKNNVDNFGFWESPTILNLDQLAAPQLFRAEFSLSGNRDLLEFMPAVRLRSLSMDFSQSDVLVATSSADGGFSPPKLTSEEPLGRTYRQLFTLPPGVPDYRLAFDTLNFDPFDFPVATIGLERVVLTARAKDSLPGERPEYAADFTDATTHGWVTGGGPPIAMPRFSSTAAGLGANGAFGGIGVPPLTFGFWSAPTGVILEAGRVYRATFLVGCDARFEQRDRIPAFRLRLADSTFRSTAYVQIESINLFSRLPSSGSPQAYEVYFQVPEEVAGNELLLAFDYLLVPVANNDPTVTLYLRDIDVVSFDAIP